MSKEVVLISDPNRENAEEKFSRKKLWYLKKPKKPRFTQILVQSNATLFDLFASFSSPIPTK
jgi:hypothetical protein